MPGAVEHLEPGAPDRRRDFVRRDELVPVVRAARQPAQHIFGAHDGEREALGGAVQRRSTKRPPGRTSAQAVATKASRVGHVLDDLHGQHRRRSVRPPRPASRPWWPGSRPRRRLSAAWRARDRDVVGAGSMPVTRRRAGPAARTGGRRRSRCRGSTGPRAAGRRVAAPTGEVPDASGRACSARRAGLSRCSGAMAPRGSHQASPSRVEAGDVGAGRRGRARAVVRRSRTCAFWRHAAGRAVRHGPRVDMRRPAPPSIRALAARGRAPRRRRRGLAGAASRSSCPEPMTRLVMKFGGTSVANIDRIRNVRPPRQARGRRRPRGRGRGLGHVGQDQRTRRLVRARPRRSTTPANTTPSSPRASRSPPA